MGWDRDAVAPYCQKLQLTASRSAEQFHPILLVSKVHGRPKSQLTRDTGTEASQFTTARRGKVDYKHSVWQGTLALLARKACTWCAGLEPHASMGHDATVRGPLHVAVPVYATKMCSCNQDGLLLDIIERVSELTKDMYVDLVENLICDFQTTNAGIVLCHGVADL